VRDRRDAQGRVVAIVRGRRWGEERERRCRLDTTIDDARFDDQQR
jgi:hypothetical protein